MNIGVPRERRTMWLVFGAVLASAVLETAGVASILPFLTMVASPDAIQDNAIVSWLFNTFGFTDVNRLLLYKGVFVSHELYKLDAGKCFVGCLESSGVRLDSFPSAPLLE